MTKLNVRHLLLLVGSVPLAIGLVACGGSSGSSDDGDSGGVTTATKVAQSAPNTGGSGEAKEIVVSMKDNIFEPKQINIGVGETVEIVAKNDGVAIHNMAVKGTEFKSDALVAKGKESEFKVKFTKAGTYEFQCDYHVPDMVGTIVVK